VRYRWAGSGGAAAVSPSPGGRLAARPRSPGRDADRLCRRARVETRRALDRSSGQCVFDDQRVLSGIAGAPVVKYGFHSWAFEARTGGLRWDHRSRSPLLAVLGSSRLPHVLVQAEVETFAIEADGTVAWRVAHSDVVAGVELVGGRLVLTSYGGRLTALDPRPAGPWVERPVVWTNGG
jgi:hypothetical protein